MATVAGFARSALDIYIYIYDPISVHCVYVWKKWYKYAMYMCHSPFVMTPNKHSFMGYMDAYSKTASEAYMDTAYTAGCYEGYAAFAGGFLNFCNKVRTRGSFWQALPNF